MTIKKALAVLHRIIVVIIMIVALVVVFTISMLFLRYGAEDLKPNTLKVFIISIIILIISIFDIIKVMKPWDKVK